MNLLSVYPFLFYVLLIIYLIKNSESMAFTDQVLQTRFHYFSGTPVEHFNILEIRREIPLCGGRIRTPPLCGGISPSAQPADLVRILPENKKEVGSCLSGIISFYFGAPGRIRTCGLRIRSPLLYPTELQAHL